MSKCPYCGGDQLTVVTTVRVRHPLQKTMHCGDCDSFAVKHKNGMVYPLSEKTNRESDAVLRSR